MKLEDDLAVSPLWVSSIGLTTRQRVPVYPGQRASTDCTGMSQKCHEETMRLSGVLVGTAKSKELVREN